MDAFGTLGYSQAFSLPVFMTLLLTGRSLDSIILDIATHVLNPKTSKKVVSEMLTSTTVKSKTHQLGFRTCVYFSWFYWEKTCTYAIQTP